MRTVKFFFIILAATGLTVRAMEQFSKEKPSSKEVFLRFECERFKNSDDSSPLMEISFRDENEKTYVLVPNGKEKGGLFTIPAGKNQHQLGMPEEQFMLLKKAQEEFEKLNKNKATLIFTGEKWLQEEEKEG